jgi:hypothetical protein
MAVSYFARGVAVQKYNPKTGVKSVLLRGGLKSDVAISSPPHCVIARSVATWQSLC